MEIPQKVTYQTGFKFSDADHDITRKEYVKMMNEMAIELNKHHNTDTITVIGDHSMEGGFMIIDSRWVSVGTKKCYKVCRHNFQKNRTYKLHSLHNDSLLDGQYDQTWLDDETILPCFSYRITYQDIYHSLFVVTDKQKERQYGSLNYINEKEQPKLRHNTVLKAYYGASLWTVAELNIIINVLRNHGINTSKCPKIINILR